MLPSRWILPRSTEDHDKHFRLFDFVASFPQIIQILLLVFFAFVNLFFCFNLFSESWVKLYSENEFYWNVWTLFLCGWQEHCTRISKFEKKMDTLWLWLLSLGSTRRATLRRFCTENVMEEKLGIVAPGFVFVDWFLSNSYPNSIQCLAVIVAWIERYNSLTQSRKNCCSEAARMELPLEKPLISRQLFLRVFVGFL